jgi:hypothetical protein
MPLPTPKKGQDKKDFVNICMDNLKMVKEFPDDEQRAAVCYSQWEKSNANVEIQDGSYVIDFSNQIKSEEKQDGCGCDKDCGCKNGGKDDTTS